MSDENEAPPLKIRKRGGPKIPDVYTHVGRLIRDKRERLGISQVTLSKACGVTFQQLQKYETGVNRVPFDKLLAIALAFSVGLDFFTRGLRNITVEDTETPDSSNAGLSVHQSKIFCEFRRLNPEGYTCLVEFVRSYLKED